MITVAIDEDDFYNQVDDILHNVYEFDDVECYDLYLDGIEELFNDSYYYDYITKKPNTVQNYVEFIVDKFTILK